MSRKTFLNNPNTRFSLIGVLLLVLLAILYFGPALGGKTVEAHDLVQVTAMSQNQREYHERTGEEAYWSTNMFSGMPAYSIGVQYKGNWLGDFFVAFQKIFGYPLAGFILGVIFSFFLLRALGVDWMLSVAGAISYCFFSYHIIIYEAGHSSKLLALLMAPGVLLGLVIAYRKNLWTGALLTAFAVALELYTNHPQMTYYLAIVAFGLVIVFFFEALKAKQLKKFLLVSLAVGAATAIGLGTKANGLLPLMDYTKYSIRGPSELSQPIAAYAGDTASTTAEPLGAGLARDYAFNWSSDRDELLTLLVPRFKGGGSSEVVSTKGVLAEKVGIQGLDRDPRTGKYVYPGYWGTQPFTSGPTYMGAIVVFLFIVGLMLVRSPIKWALLYATLLGMILALGAHSYTVLESLVLFALPVVYELLKKRVRFPKPLLGIFLLAVGLIVIVAVDSYGAKSGLLTDFFFEHLPYYNIFRTPASILVMVAMSAPWLAFLGAQALFSAEVPKEKKIQALLTSAGLLAAVLIGLILFNDYSFMSESDLNRLANVPEAQQAQAREYFKAIAEQRASHFWQDSLRSLFFILAAAAVLYLYVDKRLKNAVVAGGLVAVLVAADLLTVDMRYVSWSDFVRREEVEKNFIPHQADQYIKEYQAQLKEHGRVFARDRNPWNDALTAYHLQSVGGYSPAKLRRYQQLADVYLLNGNRIPGNNMLGLNPGVLDMLNTDYLILRYQQGIQGLSTMIPEYQYIRNTTEGEAIFKNKGNLGPAWFVQNVEVAPIPDSALMALSHINPAHTAVIEARQKEELKPVSTDSIGFNETIKETSYDNMQVEYTSNSDKPRFAVFSEIYFHDWEATIDNQPVPVFQTNYVLRGLVVPAGEHKIVFRFVPKSVYEGESISLISSILLVLGTLAVIVVQYLKWRKSPATQSEPSAKASV